jgi:DNA-binding FadR family transcriptional regulator
LQSRLPPERVLSAELGITRTSLRKALYLLESDNKIWRHVGKGTFVGAKPSPEDQTDIGRVTNATNPAEIMEARMVIEPKLAAISALRATKNDLENIQQCLIRAKSAADFSSFEHCDGVLHAAIAEASHNLLLISLFNTVNRLREDRIWGRLKEAAMNRKRQRAYNQQHQAIARAIQNRDAAEAERIMREHLEIIQKNLLGSF